MKWYLVVLGGDCDVFCHITGEFGIQEVTLRERVLNQQRILINVFLQHYDIPYKHLSMAHQQLWGTVHVFIYYIFERFGQVVMEFRGF